MKLNQTTKVLARIDTPKFQKHPLVGISIGGDGNKFFGYTRGDNFGVIGFFGIYISFRLSYKPEIIFGQGVEAGFKASTTTISYLISKINHQTEVINELAKMLEAAQDDNDEEEEDDNGFDPQWN